MSWKNSYSPNTQRQGDTMNPDSSATCRYFSHVESGLVRRVSIAEGIRGATPRPRGEGRSGGAVTVRQMRHRLNRAPRPSRLARRGREVNRGNHVSGQIGLESFGRCEDRNRCSSTCSGCPNGEPPDPALLVTAVPTWSVGDVRSRSAAACSCAWWHTTIRVAPISRMLVRLRLRRCS